MPVVDRCEWPSWRWISGKGIPSRNRSTPSWVWQSAASVLFRRPWVRHRSLSLSGVAWGDEAGFVGEHDGVDPVAQVELAQDALDVRFDGGLAEDQLAGDLCV